MYLKAVALNPDCSLEIPDSRGTIKPFLPPPGASPGQPCLKRTQVFSMMFLPGFNQWFSILAAY